jgi:hypothetical protein
VYDCLAWGLARAHHSHQRRLALKQFSGLLCVDELHLGEFTLLRATDPIADRVVGHSLVKINDQAHLRRFLLALAYWGFQPKVVVTDGSNLYPAVLAEVWPAARHPLGVFHVPRTSPPRSWTPSGGCAAGRPDAAKRGASAAAAARARSRSGGRGGVGRRTRRNRPSCTSTAS